MKMDAKEKVKLRGKAKLMEPLVRIGKNGITDSVVEQVRRLLVKRELVKIKFLRSFIDNNDRKAGSKRLAAKLGAELIDQVGFVLVLYRKAEVKKRSRPVSSPKKRAISEARSKARSGMSRHRG